VYATRRRPRGGTHAATRGVPRDPEDEQNPQSIGGIKTKWLSFGAAAVVLGAIACHWGRSRGPPRKRKCAPAKLKAAGKKAACQLNLNSNVC
jgi:hypothetical protein